jgi:hypothetical protein
MKFYYTTEEPNKDTSEVQTVQARGYDEAFEKIYSSIAHMHDDTDIHIYTDRSYQGYNWRLGGWRPYKESDEYLTAHMLNRQHPDSWTPGEWYPAIIPGTNIPCEVRRSTGRGKKAGEKYIHVKRRDGIRFRFSLRDGSFTQLT